MSDIEYIKLHHFGVISDHYNTDDFPIYIDRSQSVRFNGKPLHCFNHLSLGNDSVEGKVGALNSKNISHKIKVLVIREIRIKGLTCTCHYQLKAFCETQVMTRIIKLEFGEVRKFSRLAEQPGELDNKYTVNCIFM